MTTTSTDRSLRAAPFDGKPKVLHPTLGKLVWPCRWCGAPTTPPRVSWCSEACIHEYKIRKQPAYARQAVFERDRGVCSGCGLDAHALERWLVRMKGPARGWKATWAARTRFRRVRRDEYRPRENPKDWCGRRLRESSVGCCRFHAAVRDLRRRGFVAGKAFWEADHVRPVVEGGGSCGLENLRTLCQVCHLERTRELARRRARGRRVPAPAPLLLSLETAAPESYQRAAAPPARPDPANFRAAATSGPRTFALEAPRPPVDYRRQLRLF